MDAKISALTLGTPAQTDIFPYVDLGSNTTKKALISSFGGTFVDNETVSGSGTAFALANTPVTGSEQLFAQRQRLYPTIDYSISGTSITTILSYSSGDLLCSYRK